MPFSVTSKKTGATYYLHGQTTETKSGKRTLYYFGKEVKDGALDALPAGYTVTESDKTGLPMVKKAA